MRRVLVGFGRITERALCSGSARSTSIRMPVLCGVEWSGCEYSDRPMSPSDRTFGFIGGATDRKRDWSIVLSLVGAAVV